MLWDVKYLTGLDGCNGSTRDIRATVRTVGRDVEYHLVWFDSLGEVLTVAVPDYLPHLLPSARRALRLGLSEFTVLLKRSEDGARDEFWEFFDRRFSTSVSLWVTV